MAEPIEKPGTFPVDPLMAEYIEKPTVQPETPEPSSAPAPDPNPVSTVPVAGEVVEEVIKVKDLIGDAFGSLDEFKTAAQRGIKIKDEELEELQNLRQVSARLPELESEIGVLKSMPTLETPEYFRLEHIKKNQPEDLQFYQQMIFGGLDDVELLKRNIARENPLIKDDQASITRKLERMYPTFFDPEADRESQDYKDDALDLRLEAAKVRGSYRKIFDAIPLPEVKKPVDNTAQVAEVAASWKAASIPVDGKMPAPYFKDKDHKETGSIDIAIPAEQLKPFIEKAIEFQAVNGNKADQNSIKQVVDHAKSLWLLSNLAFYVTKIAEHVESQKETEWRSRVGNVATTPPPEKTTSPAAIGDVSDQVAKHLGFT